MDGLIQQWDFENSLGSSDPFPQGVPAAAEVVYLVEATVYDPALPGTKTLRYCSGGGYVLDGNYYEPRIKHPGRLKRMLFGDGKTSGAGQIGYGEVVLINTDGALDALSTYGFDGRQLMIKRALATGAALASVVLLAACGMEQATYTWDEVAIRVKDRKQELNVPLQANKYGGTNALPAGVDGTADIQGKPKPLLYGVVKNATPVCVNTSKLIYQLHDVGTPGVNVAAAANGGVATASSTYPITNHSPAFAINGDRKTWGVQGTGVNGGWNDYTQATYPDWLQVTFNASYTIRQINVITIQDSYTAPVEPTFDMTFASLGITSFEVQYWTGSAWANVPGGSVTGNDRVIRQLTFDPVVTNQIRVLVHAVADDMYSRIVEVEAFTGAPLLVSGVYDKGVPLTRAADYASQAEMEANAPLAGQYRAWSAGGMFRLGANPAGQITADATEGPTALERSAARLAERIASRAIAAGDITAADVTALHTANSAEVGYYANAETTVAAALDAVIGSIGGWYGFDATGKLRLGRLDAPAGSPVATLTEAELPNIERLPTSDDSRGLPAWRVNLNYDRNWSVGAGSLGASINLTPWGVVGLPLTGRWWDLAYGAGLFVATNAHSDTTATYATSPDGVTWTQRTLPVSGRWSAIVYGGGQFVMLSENSLVALTSPDGLTWTQRTLPSTTAWAGLRYGNGIYVAASQSNWGLTSPDGITWTLRTLPTSAWGGVAFGGGLFVLHKDTTEVYTSTDGIDWTSRPLVGIMANGCRAVIYAEGRWLAVSLTGEMAISADGLVWTRFGGMVPSGQPAGLITGGGAILASEGGNSNPTVGDRSYLSADGLVWTQQRLPVADVGWWRGTYGNGVFVLIDRKLGKHRAAALSLPAAAARALWLANPHRTVTASNASTQTVHPLARELNVDTLLASQTAAQAEAARLLALHSADRVRLRVKVPRALVPADVLGQPVLLQVPRYGWQAGKLLLVIGAEEDLAADLMWLDLWG